MYDKSFYFGWTVSLHVYSVYKLVNNYICLKSYGRNLYVSYINLKLLFSIYSTFIYNPAPELPDLQDPSFLFSFAYSYLILSSYSDVMSRCSPHLLNCFHFRKPLFFRHDLSRLICSTGWKSVWQSAGWGRGVDQQISDIEEMCSCGEDACYR